MKKVIIVGANFTNKGAQSMLFITTAEILKREPDCEIYFATSEEVDEELYVFKKVLDSPDSRRIALGTNIGFAVTKSFFKDIAKFVCGKHNNLWKSMQLRDLLPNVDLMIDISGFSLGEKWRISVQEKYLDHIRLAKQYQIPMILMPQSFGPFNYDNDKKYLLDEMMGLLNYPKIIFARERDGFESLTKTFGLTNVKLSTDLVLQNSSIDMKKVYRREIQLQIPDIPEKDAVGIVPNSECLRHAGEETVFGIYRIIIDKILTYNKEVYIFRHSSYDVNMCEQIYSMYKDEPHVHLLQNDFSCIEYDELVKKFEFIVCSRYHGIVHAYRNGIPCIILGWAIKYSELAEIMGQQQYIFNIVNDKVGEDELSRSIKTMITSVTIESEKINEKVSEIKKNNCFSVLDEYL